MSNKSEVIEVLDLVISTIDRKISPESDFWLSRVEGARAAVAELIEAADDICYEVSDRSDGKRLLIKALDRVKGRAE